MSKLKAILIVLLLGVLLLWFAVAQGQSVTVTVDGEVIDDISGVTIAISTDGTEPPVEPPVEPPIEPPIDPPPIDPPPAQCEHTDLPVLTRGWKSWWGQAFPLPSYKNQYGYNYTVPNNGFLSIQFDTRGFVDDGTVSLLENSTTPGLRWTSISECKGDLDVDTQCKKVHGLGGGIKWATNGKFGACHLKPNTVYYYNVTFVDPNGISQCTADRCYITTQHVNL